MSPFVSASDLGTGGALTLPGRYFTSSDVFAEEQETIFVRHWLCVGREEDIPRQGDYFVRTLGSESVIVLRDEAQRIRAFHKVCSSS